MLWTTEVKKQSWHGKNVRSQTHSNIYIFRSLALRRDGDDGVRRSFRTWPYRVTCLAVGWQPLTEQRHAARTNEQCHIDRGQ